MANTSEAIPYAELAPSREGLANRLPHEWQERFLEGEYQRFFSELRSAASMEEDNEAVSRNNAGWAVSYMEHASHLERQADAQSGDSPESLAAALSSVANKLSLSLWSVTARMPRHADRAFIALKSTKSHVRIGLLLFTREDSANLKRLAAMDLPDEIRDSTLLELANGYPRVGVDLASVMPHGNEDYAREYLESCIEFFGESDYQVGDAYLLQRAVEDADDVSKWKSLPASLPSRERRSLLAEVKSPSRVWDFASLYEEFGGMPLEFARAMQG